MKTSAVLTLAAAGAAMAAPAKRDSSSFGGIAINSGSAIQLSTISATSGGFYLNQESSADCPTISGVDCSDYNNYTTFAGGDNTLYLDVSVPGGQQVYVAPAGQLLYTTPHSDITGSGNTTGFAKSGTSLTYNGGGFLACPVKVDSGSSYQIWAYSAASSDLYTKCIDFEFRMVENTSGKHAYEYN